MNDEFYAFVKDLARIMAKHKVVIENRIIDKTEHTASTRLVINGKELDIHNAWEVFDCAQEESRFKYISDTQNDL